ncbi:unnamed protein product [Orchesella dallaii]|uniref:C2H2-type domain-containing protein n=1 Tax=Orchesella dallaii TaxID=48710 RepID=A0ABP1RNP2_9HEXA
MSKCTDDWESYSELYHQWECFRLNLLQKVDKLASLIKSSDLDASLVAAYRKQFKKTDEAESIGTCIQNFRETLLKNSENRQSDSVPKLVLCQLNLDNIDKHSINEIQKSGSSLEEANDVQDEFHLKQLIIPIDMAEHLRINKREKEGKFFVSEHEQDFNYWGSVGAPPEAHNDDFMLHPGTDANQMDTQNLKTFTDVGNELLDNLKTGRNGSKAPDATASEFRKNDLEEGEHDPNNIPMDLSMAKEKENMEVSDIEQDFSYSGSFGALRAAYADESMSLPGSGGTQNFEAFAAIYDEPPKNENAEWSDREAVVVTAREFRISDLEGGEHFPDDMEVDTSGHQPQAHDLCQQNNDTVLELCDDISTFDNEEASDVYNQQVDKINAAMNERDNDPYFEMDSITEQEAILAVAAVTDEVEFLSQPAPFTCPICPGAILRSKYSLGRHLKMVHNRILAYQCDRFKTRLQTVNGFQKSHVFYTRGQVYLHGKVVIRRKCSLQLLKCSGGGSCRVAVPKSNGSIVSS